MMTEIQEPHSHRDDCSLCLSTVSFHYCEPCGDRAIVNVNGHATAEQRTALEICGRCQTPFKLVGRHEGVDGRDHEAILALYNRQAWPQDRRQPLYRIEPAQLN